ncbi:MAG: polysaccharide lyase family protein [Bryobacteraceae bacterium]
MTQFSVLCVFLALLPLIQAQPEKRTIWQIGKFDQSPVEFSDRPAKAVDFHVGTSDPGKEWPGRQAVGVPYRVLFSLSDSEGPYSLKIGILIDRPRVPSLLIDLNGHAGAFYLHPKLSYSRSDFSYAFDPHEAQSTLSIDLPSSFLKRGENILTITPIDDPRTPAGEEEIGGISYDALSLQNGVSEAANSPDVKTDVEPTIFSINRDPGSRRS